MVWRLIEYFQKLDPTDGKYSHLPSIEHVSNFIEFKFYAPKFKLKKDELCRDHFTNIPHVEEFRGNIIPSLLQVSENVMDGSVVGDEAETLAFFKQFNPFQADANMIVLSKILEDHYLPELNKSVVAYEGDRSNIITFVDRINSNCINKININELENDIIFYEALNKYKADKRKANFEALIAVQRAGNFKMTHEVPEDLKPFINLASVEKELIDAYAAKYDDSAERQALDAFIVELHKYVQSLKAFQAIAAPADKDPARSPLTAKYNELKTTLAAFVFGSDPVEIWFCLINYC